MASMAASGASRPRCFLRAVSRAAEKIGALSVGVAELFVALARFGRGLSGDFAGKRNGAGEKIAFDDAVDDAELQRVLGL